MVRKVDREVNRTIQEEQLMYGFDDCHYEEQFKKLGNLWFVVKFYMAINIYLLAYTLVSLVMGVSLQSTHSVEDPIKSCNVLTTYNPVDEIFWVIKRCLA